MNADIDIAQMASLANNQIPQHHYDPHQQHEGSPEGSPEGGKRKADDNGQPQQRAKRNRYISIACNEVRSIEYTDFLMRKLLTLKTVQAQKNKM